MNGAGSRAILLAGLLALAAGIAQLPSIPSSSAFGWDEAEHAWHGAVLASDLRRLDLPQLWADTSRQAFWPPGQSWYLGPILAVTGPRTQAARAASLPLIVLAVLLCAWIAGTLAPRAPSVAALAAAFFSLGSRNLLLYGRSVYAEPLLLVLVLLATALWIRAIRIDRGRDFLLVGLTTAATFLVKYPYGLLLLGIGASATLLLAAVAPSTARRSALAFLLPAVALDAAWLLLPVPPHTASHREQFLAFFAHNLSVQDHHPWTYYLDSFQKSCASSLLPALFMGSSVLGLSIPCLRRLMGHRRLVGHRRLMGHRREDSRPAGNRRDPPPLRDAATVFVALQIVLFLATASLAGAKQERVLLPWAGAPWILGGVAGAHLISRCAERRGSPWRGRVLLGVLLAAGYLVPVRLGGTIPGPEGWHPHEISLPSPRENLRYLYGFHDVPSACYPGAEPILDFVAEHAPPRGFSLWLGGFDEFSPFLLRWTILEHLSPGPDRDAFLQHEPFTIVERDPFPAATAIEPGGEEERIFFERASGFDAVFTLEPPDPKDRPLRAHLRKYVEAFLRHPGFRPVDHETVRLAVREGRTVPTTVTLHLPLASRGPQESGDHPAAANTDR